MVGLERAWCVAYQRGKQGIAVGFDDGAVVIKMGREQPAASMDVSGKIIWSRHNEIQTAQIKGVGECSNVPALWILLSAYHVMPVRLRNEQMHR